MFKELNTLKPFLDEPERAFHIREIASILEISPATASKKLKNLQKEGILIHQKMAILDLFRANLSSEEYKDIKIYYNIKRLRDVGLIKGLNEHFLKPTIILFGSASFGNDTSSSDYDLCILSEVSEEFDKSNYEEKLGRKIQLFLFNSFPKEEIVPLVNSILSGKTLQGEVKWI